MSQYLGRGAPQPQNYQRLLPHPFQVPVHQPPPERQHYPFQVQVRPPPHAKPHQPFQVQVHQPLPERQRGYRKAENSAELEPIINDYKHISSALRSYKNIAISQQKLETVNGWIRQNPITFKGQYVNSSDFHLDESKMLIEYVDSSGVNPRVYIYISKRGKYTLFIPQQHAAQKAVAIVADELMGLIEGINEVLGAY
jgi:hypothetical protein